MSWIRFATPIGIFCLCGLGVCCYTALSAQPKLLHVSIKADIDVRTHRHLELALAKAKALRTELVILELDTYGGALADADKMRQLLLAFEQPVYVFINKNAASAGALISIACDSIYMAPGASIGAATVVTGMGEAAPDKYQSYMRGIMRATAEAQGRNPTLAEAMVDPDVEIDSLAPKGKVLTLTTQQALQYDFCEAQINSMDSLINHLSLQAYTRITYTLPPTERVIAFFINPVISSILILLILWGLYAELQTPGLGLAGAVAVVALLLYLIPYYLNGLAANWEILVLILGIGLIAVELFILPGFGITGLAGAVMVVSTLILFMLNNDFFDFSLVPSADITKATTAVFSALLGGGALFLLAGGRLIKMHVFQRLTLPNNMDPQAGYRVLGSSAAGDCLLEKTGIAYTVLRPSGKVQIEGKVYEATVATGHYLAAGTPILVVSEEGRELRVTPHTHPTTA